jgi:Ca2+-binding EF-hand superfamily protein
MSHLTEHQIKSAVDATFSKYDTDRNGILEDRELLPMLQDAVHYLGKNYMVNDQDVKDFLAKADINNNKKI